MKSFLFVLTFFIFMLTTQSAFSYIEIGDKGDAEATSGEQTGNLYRLNAQGMFAVKKLKKVDAIITRDEKLGKNVTFYDVNDLLASDAEQREKQEMQRLLKELDKTLTSPKRLRVGVAIEKYKQIQSMQAVAQDKEVAAELLNGLTGWD